ncbi:sensor histidine kinase [Rasiella rasia]|uniref:histidine kinase n=1 Tax=Rasiella rasia TaxID=2744027 RepID=A0A6G6GI37_9FLAO|nr:sensor histidine kinase [Rasiella rasia]QIE58170.1 sensor histidine kinase [Rasiella rasia]
MDQTEIAALVSVLILLVLVGIIITLVTVFVRRKNKLLREQKDAQEAFETELSETQIEIREETLRNISWELHDNIGQLMTLAKIQVQLAKEKPETIDEASETIGKGINELRALSKLINPEALKSLNLREAIRLEMERFNRIGFINANYSVVGLPFSIGSKKEIIVFRILQEFFSNTIKHSKATHLDVVLIYTENELLITAKDNGVGFSDEKDFSGIGIKNMRNRAKVIDAEFSISSEPKVGTMLRMLCKE